MYTEAMEEEKKQQEEARKQVSRRRTPGLRAASVLLLIGAVLAAAIILTSGSPHAETAREHLQPYMDTIDRLLDRTGLKPMRDTTIRQEERSEDIEKRIWQKYME